MAAALISLMACQAESGMDLPWSSEGAEIVLVSAAEIAAAQEIRLVRDSGYAAGSPRVELNGPLVSALDSDGNLYLLDRLARTVWVTDSIGNKVGVIGGPGQGPGEFEQPYLLAVRGDTILVMEFMRYHLFLRDGTPLRTDRPALGRAGRVSPIRIAGTQHGWSLVTWHSGEDDGVTRWRDTLALRWFAPDSGTAGAALVKLPTATSVTAGRHIVERFMDATPSVAAARGGVILATTGREYVVAAMDHSGKALREIRADVIAPKVTHKEFEDVLNAMIVMTEHPDEDTREEVREALRKYAKSNDYSPRRPVLGQILASADGSFLVFRSDLRSTGTLADAVGDWFDSAGHLRGRLRIPSGTSVLALDNDRLYAVVTGADLVPALARFHLVKD